MIIDKVKQYKTDDDRRRQMELEEQAQALEATFTDNMTAAEFWPIMEKIQKCTNESDDINAAVEARYIDDRGPDQLVSDALEIITALEITDFKRYSEIRKQELAKFKNDAALAPLKEWTLENYRNAYYYVMFFLRVQLNALNSDTERHAKVIDAIGAKAAEWYPETAIKEKEQLAQITYKNSAEVGTVTDKFAKLFFSMAPPQSPGTINGQRAFIPVGYEAPGEKKEITLFYDYSFNEKVIREFGLSKNFDDQSFFVASIIDNLFEEGNRTVSITKIWHELGNSGSPSTEALDNIINILRLGLSTIITADISQVKDAWHVSGKELSRELISPVIPVQIAREKFAANGKTANAIINITGHTPFYIIARPLGHISTWDKDILRLYTGRKTKRYYSVLRFLITQIGWMRNAKSQRSNKIKYATLYEHTGDKTTRMQQLTRDMMYRLLDEVFIPTGYIIGYKEDTSGDPGVRLTYTKAPRITAKK